MTGHAALDQLHARARRLAVDQLAADEPVVTVIAGRSRQAMVVTDRQIVVVKPGILAGFWLGAKASAFPLEQITSVNVHTGRGILALELVIAGSTTTAKPDLTTAFQTSNWLPCHASFSGSEVIGELRTYIESDGRSRSARAELAAYSSV